MDRRGDPTGSHTRALVRMRGTKKIVRFGKEARSLHCRASACRPGRRREELVNLLQGGVQSRARARDRRRLVTGRGVARVLPGRRQGLVPAARRAGGGESRQCLEFGSFDRMSSMPSLGCFSNLAIIDRACQNVATGLGPSACARTGVPAPCHLAHLVSGRRGAHAVTQLTDCSHSRPAPRHAIKEQCLNAVHASSLCTHKRLRSHKKVLQYSTCGTGNQVRTSVLASWEESGQGRSLILILTRPRPQCRSAAPRCRTPRRSPSAAPTRAAARPCSWPFRSTRRQTQGAASSNSLLAS